MLRSFPSAGYCLLGLLCLSACPLRAHDWNGLVADKQDNLYVCDADSERIWKVTPDGRVQVFVDSKRGRQMCHVHHLAIDELGDLRVASG